MLAGVTLSALCAVPMESRFQIGLECFAKVRRFQVHRSPAHDALSSQYYVDGLFYRARITDKSVFAAFRPNHRF